MSLLNVQEMIYVWNGFSIIGKKEKLLQPILTFVEETINVILKNKSEPPIRWGFCQNFWRNYVFSYTILEIH